MYAAADPNYFKAPVNYLHHTANLKWHPINGSMLKGWNQIPKQTGYIVNIYGFNKYPDNVSKF